MKLYKALLLVLCITACVSFDNCTLFEVSAILLE